MNRFKPWLYVGGIAWLGLIILAMGIVTYASWINLIDQPIMHLASVFRSPTNTAAMRVVAQVFSPVVMSEVAVIVIALAWRFNRSLALWSTVTYFGGSVVAWVLKKVVNRPRPTGQLLPDQSASFPSGHTICMLLLGIIASAVAYYYFQDAEQRFVVVILAILGLILVICARLYLRNHYGTDILGSLLLGTAWSSTTVALWRGKLIREVTSDAIQE